MERGRTVGMQTYRIGYGEAFAHWGIGLPLERSWCGVKPRQH